MTERAKKPVPEGGLMTFIPHMKELGALMVEMQPGSALVCVPYSERLIGDPATGILHGGVMTALLDNASGVAVHSTMKKRVSIATLDLRIDYMKPASVGRDLFARATCYKTTRNVAFVRGVAFHESEADPVATSAASFMLASNQTKKLATS